jgi:hypothetical protein
MMASRQGLTKEFLAERDLRIFAMRKAGVSPQDIARRFSMNTKAVNAALARQLGRMNAEAVSSYPEVLRLELERLDALQQAIWPMTQHRKVTLDDGTEVNVEPDLKAIQSVLSIMSQRSKLLGMDQNNLNMTVEQIGAGAEPRAVLAGAVNGAEARNAFDPETEARKLLELMGRSGVLPQAAVDEMLGIQAALPPSATVEAEVIEDVEQRSPGQLGSGDGEGRRDDLNRTVEEHGE